MYGVFDRGWPAACAHTGFDLPRCRLPRMRARQRRGCGQVIVMLSGGVCELGAFELRSLCSVSGLAVVRPIRCPRGAVPSLLRGGLEHMQAGRFISTHFCPREGGVHGPVCVCMRMRELRVRSASAAHAGGSAPIHVHAALLWQTECWSTSSHHRTTTFKSERCHKQSRPCCSCLTSVHVNPP